MCLYRKLDSQSSLTVLTETATFCRNPLCLQSTKTSSVALIPLSEKFGLSITVRAGEASVMFSPKAWMSWYQIREYRDADYAAVRKIYSTGFREHVGTVYLHALKQPWTQAVLCGVFLLIHFLSGSLLTCVVAVGGVLLAVRVAVQYFFEQGIQLGLREDLLDIRSSYMQTGNRSCFWVAEQKGSIVGTVGILPCVEEPGAWELKRISVKGEFRGRGLAKALCKTALEFVARHDVRRVVLFTSMVQTDAHKLYDSIGFHKEEGFVWPSFPGRLINFMVFKYAHRTEGVMSC